MIANDQELKATPEHIRTISTAPIVSDALQGR